MYTSHLEQAVAQAGVSSACEHESRSECAPPQDAQTACILILSPSLNQVQTDFHLNLHSVFETDQGSQQTMAGVFAYTQH